MLELVIASLLYALLGSMSVFGLWCGYQIVFGRRE